MAPFSACAHDPLEITARLIVLPDRMELRVSAGSDAARMFLKKSGFTPHQVAAMTLPTGAVTKLDASTPPALSFFEFREGGRPPMEAKTWTVISADTEIRFTAEYARPVIGTLDVRALYFTAGEDLLPGSFAAISTEKELASATLSRENDSLRVLVPVAPASMEGAPLVIPHPSAPPSAAPAAKF